MAGRSDVRSPLAGSVVALLVEVGQAVERDDVLAVIESMKMEHEVRAERSGQVASLAARVGEVVASGDLLATLDVDGTHPAAPSVARVSAAPRAPLRTDLLGLQMRESKLADSSRPQAVAKRHALGLRTARENIADLCDAGSFVEYGALAYAAQRGRRELDDLIRNTPADGMVTGIGS
ncbi:MAG: biotin/lipoyl-containing protein, partial [Caldimonas sp.]